MEFLYWLILIFEIAIVIEICHPFILTGIPETISTTSSAFEARNWFIQPWSSVNFRPMWFSAWTPIPISFVTIIRVTFSWFAIERNYFFAFSRLKVTSYLWSTKKLVSQSVTQSIKAVFPEKSIFFKFGYFYVIFQSSKT